MTTTPQGTTEAEDLPGYDGPTYDPYSRLQVFMDRSVPAADRDRLIDEYRDSLLPAWEAVYEPGNVSDYLIGYTNDEIPAKRAAEAWFRAQRLDEVGTIDWISDPVMAVREYDVWHELVEVGDDFEVLSKPGIIVRHRATRATATLEG